MSESGDGSSGAPAGLLRLADRVLLALAACLALGCVLAIWYALIRPTTPHGGRYTLLTVGVGAVLAACVAFPLMRRRLYRFVGPLQLCLLVGGALLPLLVFELAANFVDLRGFLYYAQSERYFHWQAYEGVAVAHAHPPNAELALRWGTIRTNAEGWRSPEIALERDPQTLRVLGLGDSVMFSWGVDEPDTLRAALERALTRRLDELPGYRRVEVINTGNCSFSSVDELILMRSRGLAYDPSGVLLLAIENDFIDRPAYRDQVEFLRAAGPHDSALIDTLAASAVPREPTLRTRTGMNGAVFYGVAYALKRSFLATSSGGLVRRLRSRQAVDPPVEEAPNAEPPEATAQAYPYLHEQTAALRELALLLRARDIPLLVVVFRARDLTRHLRAELEPLAGVHHLEFPDELDWMTLRNSYTDAHWNREGNEVMAAALAQMLIAKLRDAPP